MSACGGPGRTLRESEREGPASDHDRHRVHGFTALQIGPGLHCVSAALRLDEQSVHDPHDPVGERTRQVWRQDVRSASGVDHALGPAEGCERGTNERVGAVQGLRYVDGWDRRSDPGVVHGMGRSRLPLRLCRPAQRLGDDDALTIEGDGGAFVEFISKANEFAHTLTERGVVRAGQDSVDGQSIWWCAHEEKDLRLPGQPSRRASMSRNQPARHRRCPRPASRTGVFDPSGHGRGCRSTTRDRSSAPPRRNYGHSKRPRRTRRLLPKAARQAGFTGHASIMPTGPE